MVKIEQLGALDVDEYDQENDEDYTDVSGSEYDEEGSELGSDLDDDEDDYYEEESLLDRITALKDIIPLSQRTAMSNFVSTMVNTGCSSINLFGKVAWVLSTSALVLLVPLALESEKDQALAQYENEAALTQPASPQGGLQPGVYPPGAPIQASAPGQPSPPSLAPPGF
ncbi:mitochondrial import receptor subunit Tom22 [Tieghemiomyces parasiticus]|uniref:Mitochondrial import receptor subunit Tom22 n=1 Tax=Tieghemiomyces parasiticus TaxID=78921 RepID=A0A9W8A5T8_9FUNG|nr:mitochondrial import receptor subunit Tom22 [Tieghemiomyces parasiticus]